MRVVFMGTPDFSVPALRSIAARHQVVAVYSQPPRAAGRGQKPRPSPVQAAAESLGLTVRTPLNLKSDDDRAEFASWDADVAVVVAYGLILPQAVLDAPRLGCLNIHASILPRWRGAAPIHRAVMAGDTEAGIAIMQMEAGLDTGPVLAEARVPIAPTDTTGDLHDRLSQLGARLIVETLDRLPLPATPQPADGVTYATKIDKAEARIDWTQPADTVDRLIRGLSPVPGAWCIAGDERLKLLRSRMVPGSGAPGQLIGPFTVACGDGAVEIIEAQRQGKRPMPAAEILRGLTLPDRLD
ncbi:MAG: methionyl-tRNA formyltransferase [Paracoccus denitrificans]|nr:MAG: methionyl-tRNA formyltransferase [Paracoccus denitrificans]PZO85237.1 MAG: methionyl-tRNA formyltransferase [Paracoccus denitrificans]